MKEAVVCDSSCLIALDRIGHLDLLPALFHPVQAPPAVQQEFGSSPDWLRVEAPTDRALVTALGPLLDDLAENEFRLSESLRQEALRLAGES